jgi:NAD(P) transhydrogenase
VPGGPLVVALKSGRKLEVDKILYSAGRAGNTAGLDLEAAGVKKDERGRIPVNEHFQTSQPHVYAAGDVAGPPALASVSMEQGRVAGVPRLRLRLQDPGLAGDSVRRLHHPRDLHGGPHRGGVRKEGVDYEVGPRPLTPTTPAADHRRPDGTLKLLVDVSTHKLLGCTSSGIAPPSSGTSGRW